MVWIADPILLGDGSGEFLKLSAVAFTGPMTNGKNGSGRGKCVVAYTNLRGDPRSRENRRRRRLKIPLNSAFGHDLPKMLAAAKGGLIYICNPNNPTVSITPRNDLRDFISKAPKEE